MEIRRAAETDYADVAALTTEVGVQHHSALPNFITPDPMSEATFRSLLANGNYGFMLGVDHGEVVGYLVYTIVEQPADEYFYAQRNLYIQEIGVFEKHQRKGYGVALMNHAVEAANAQGVKRVTLRVWNFNEGAIAFYQRMGFAGQTMLMARDL